VCGRYPHFFHITVAVDRPFLAPRERPVLYLMALSVMAALEAAIQSASVCEPKKAWMAGSSPAMTMRGPLVVS